MSKSKSTPVRAGKRRAADTTKSHSVATVNAIGSDKKWAKAILFIKDEGGLTVPSVNPFVQSTGSSDTVDYVIAALEYLSRVAPTDEGVTKDPRCQFGAHLLMGTLVEALKTSNEQSKHEYKVSRARGILAALEGTK